MPTNNKPLRGEVWRINFAPSMGAEIQKIRPAVVMNIAQVGRLPLFIVVPITNWREDYENFVWFTPLAPHLSNGLEKISGADAFQVKSVSEARFISRIGALTAEQIEEIAYAVALCVGAVES